MGKEEKYAKEIWQPAKKSWVAKGRISNIEDLICVIVQMIVVFRVFVFCCRNRCQTFGVE